MIHKSKPVDRHEDSKNVSSKKKVRIKTNSDNTKDNILNYEAGVI